MGDLLRESIPVRDVCGWALTPFQCGAACDACIERYCRQKNLPLSPSMTKDKAND